MKRFFILLTTVFFLIGAFSFAEESVLIDFSKLTADYPSDNPTENQRTLVDYADNAGTSYSDDEKALMKTSIAIKNWEVKLAPSSRRIANQALTTAKEVPVLETAKKYAGQKVLGARINFIDENFNAYAIIKPPFELPGYMKMSTLDGNGRLVADETDKQGNKFVDGFGVVKNVGVIKSISMNVYGSNFPHGIEIMVKDQNNEEKHMFIDYLKFEGWRTITWKNPSYITDVRNRELYQDPLYPQATPLLKLSGIRVIKDAASKGTDAMVYIKDITIVYDKAVVDFERDIDEEAIWGILTEREDARRTAEFSKLGAIQVLRYLEEKKMHVEGSASSTGQNAGAADAAAGK